MGGGKGSTSTSTMQPPKEIMEAYKKSLGMAEQATQTPYQQYSGQLVANLNPTQQQGIANVNASQGAALPYIQQGAQYTAQGAQGVTPGLINQFMSPYLSNVVGATQKNLLESQQQQTSGLRSGAIQAGAFGGDRSGIAQAEMARQQGLAGGQVIGGLLNQGYGQALAGAQNQVQNYFTGGQQMAGMGTAAQGSMLQGAQAQMAAGAQQQATEQTQLQAAYDQFLQRQAYPYQQAQFYANIAQGIGAGAGGTSSTTTPGPNVGSQLLGGLGAVASIYGASDERLKENIKPVGKTNDGQTIYKYNFKGSPKTEIGLLAQEVEKRTPDAVREFDGYKAVDYDEATKGAENTHGHSTPSKQNSMGGVVAPSMDRQPFASGGLSGMPYVDFETTPFGKSWLPTGDTGRSHKSGATLAEPPKPYVDAGLGEAFSNIQAMNPKQLAGLKAGLGKAGADLSDYLGIEGDLKDYFGFETAKRGGLIVDRYQQGGGVGARHQYATDGMVATLPIENADLGSVPKAEGQESGVIPKAPDAEQVRQRAISRTQQFEGGRLERDTNGTLTNYGINQAANPDIDVSKLDAGQAAQIMRERYWNTIGGDQLAAQNPNLAHVAHDTSVMAGPGRAKAMLEASGGDPLKFMDLRDEFTQRLVAQNPEKYGRFAKSWANRSDALRKDIGAGETAPGLSPPVDAGAGVVGVQPASDKQLTEEHKRNLFEKLMGRDFSPEANAGLLAASLGMMAGRSPFFGVNVGEGGLAGLKTYYNALGQQRETAKTRADIESTLATARETGSKAGASEIGVLRLLQNSYNVTKALSESRGETAPSWEKFLSDQGYGNRGWESQNPSPKAPASRAPIAETEPQQAPIGGTEASPAQTPAQAPAAPASTPTEQTAPEAPTVPSMPAPDEPYSSENAPSAIIQPTDANESIPNTLPNQNPAMLVLQGTPEAQAQLKALRDQGYVVDLSNRRIPITSTAEMETRQQLNNEASAQFTKVQENIPQINSVLNEISKVLQGYEATKITDLQKNVSGILYSITGNRESLENATAGDLLDKLFKQLSLASQVGGDAGAAGIEKIRQVESASGTPTMSAPALREVIGKSKALNDWNKDRIKDWGNFIEKNKASGISDAMRTEWLQSWGDKLDAYYVPKSIANTPVKDESLWKKNDQGKYDLRNFKKGWQYVMPNGKIARYAVEDGKPKFTAVEQ